MNLKEIKKQVEEYEKELIKLKPKTTRQIMSPMLEDFGVDTSLRVTRGLKYIRKDIVLKKENDVILQITLKDAEGFLKDLELISSKYCGCNRCPSCDIFRNKSEKELKQIIKYCEGELR